MNSTFGGESLVHRMAPLVLVLGLTACIDPGAPATEGRNYHLHGSATGLLENVETPSCQVYDISYSETVGPYVEIDLTFGENDQVGDPPRFSPFFSLILSPHPPEDRTRVATVALASTRDADYTVRFDFPAVAVEYEYGVPVRGSYDRVLWIHRLTIPQQTVDHPKYGKFDVSGELDGLVMNCFDANIR